VASDGGALSSTTSAAKRNEAVVLVEATLLPAASLHSGGRQTVGS
jgi:hypothetical protein